MGYHQRFAVKIAFVGTELWGTDPFGRVKSGRIGLVGRVLRVSFRDTREVGVRAFNNISVHNEECRCDFDAKVHPDDEMHEKSGADLYMIVFAFAAFGGMGLLLSADAEDGTFRRVGMVDSLAKESRGSHCTLPCPEPSTIVIV